MGLWDRLNGGSMDPEIRISVVTDRSAIRVQVGHDVVVVAMVDGSV